MTDGAEPTPGSAARAEQWALSALAGGVALVPLFLVCQVVDAGSGTTGTAAFGFLTGVLVGALLGACRLAMGGVPAALATLLWSGGGAAGGLLAAARVGAFAKLHSEHSRMAWAAIVGGLVAGDVVGAFLAELHRTSRSTPWRAGATSGVAYLTALALTVLEPTVWVLRGYPAARTTLVVVAWLLGAAALRGVVTVVFRGAPRALYAALAVLSLAALGRAATLGPSDLTSLLDVSQSREIVVALRNATDFDGDGASAWLGGGDCAPFDPHVGPHVAEIPGNGVDDNCSYGDAPLPRRAPGEPDPPPPTEPSPVNVVFVTVDALRPDHTTPYGYARQTTPNLGLFARDATRFEHAYTSGGWTALAIPSALYGVYPRAISWQVVALTTGAKIVPFPWAGHMAPDESFLLSRTVPVEEPHRDLPRWLGRRGMRTTAVLAQRLVGFPEVFAEDFESFHVGNIDRDDAVADLAIAELSVDDRRPFFMWVHFFEPHAPAGEAPGAPDFGSALEDRYDRDIAYCDIQIGRLFRAIDALPAKRPTAVIVASDHGEVLRDGQQAHGLDLSLDAVRIVLLAKGPGLSGGVTEAPASLVDVAPTILAWTKTPAPKDLDGSDLRALPPDRVVLADLWRHTYSGDKYIDQSVALDEHESLTYDGMLGQKTLARVDGRGRPPSALTTPPPPALDRALGTYLDRARPVP